MATKQHFPQMSSEKERHWQLCTGLVFVTLSLVELVSLQEGKRPKLNTEETNKTVRAAHLDEVGLSRVQLDVQIIASLPVSDMWFQKLLKALFAHPLFKHVYFSMFPPM